MLNSICGIFNINRVISLLQLRSTKKENRLITRKTRTDSYRHKGMRKKMVEELHQSGIYDENVLEAMEKVPRHFFIDDAFVQIAYENKAFPIGSGQTISHPYTVAFQSQLLECDPGMKVLEIGTGSGYQACVLNEMGINLYTVERWKNLFDKTSNLLVQMGYSEINTFHGDGFEGVSQYAPYDRIIVTAAAPYISEELKMQLAVGGLLVAPIGEGEVQQMIRISRLSDDVFETEFFDNFSFVPMLKGLK